jgi:CRISPR-associated protein Cmr4
MSVHLITVHAMSALHPGTGSADGTIDMPIAREKTTNVPIIPGSTIKGVLRSMASQKLATRFGDVDRAGMVQFSDVFTLLLPVRSLAGVYALVTSPYLIRRFLRDTALAGKQAVLNAQELEQLQVDSAFVHVTKKSVIKLNDQRVVFEDLDLRVESSTSEIITQLADEIQTYAPQVNASNHLCVVSDDTMSFLLETATEIRGRNRLDDNKVVVDGQLWYEEMLPAESLLCGIMNIVAPADQRESIFNELVELCKKPVVFGGKATTGHGYCTVTIKK